jgi:acetyltransferase-like isoleucine patch superfamily enzyme
MMPAADATPGGVLRRLRATLAAAVHRAGAALAAATAPPAPDPLRRFRRSGLIHASAWYDPQAGHGVDDRAAVHLGAESMLCGAVYFLRAGVFRLGARSYVGPQTVCRVAREIVIGSDVMIAWGCSLLDTNMHSLCFTQRAQDVLITGRHRGLDAANKDWSVVRCEPIRIEDRAWIGFGSSILPGVTIGAGCIVGAGSVVDRDTPPWTIVAGNRARVVRPLTAAERGAPPAARPELAAAIPDAVRE